MRIVVVNNGSSYSLATVIPSDLPVELIESKDNLGFAAACNIGAALAKGKYLLFLNPDIVVKKGSIESMIGWMNQHPEAGGAGGLLLSDSGDPQFGFMARCLPSLASVVAEAFFLDELPYSRFYCHGYGSNRLSLKTPSVIEQPAGACFLIRRDLFEKVGGFDSRFWPAWFEDVDLCYRLHRAAVALYFLPFACFGHTGASSMATLPWPRFMGIYHSNMVLFFQKHFGSVNLFFVRFILSLGMILRLTLLPFSFPKQARSRKTAARGYCTAIRSIWRST